MPCAQVRDALAALPGGGSGCADGVSPSGGDGGGGGDEGIHSRMGGGPITCLVGGVDSLDAAEGAVREGFALVQIARGLIREPRLVALWTDALRAREAEAGAAAAAAGAAAEAAGAVGAVGAAAAAGGAGAVASRLSSGCTHCNECVLSTLDPVRGMMCPERSDARTRGGDVAW